MLKRALDIIVSGMGLVVLSPILLILALLVRIKLGAPVLFVQERVGKDSKIFRIHKFRSMVSHNGNPQNQPPDEARLTKFGRVLRSTSLDELPELWDVFRGRMSLVGPRPLLPKYLELYTPRQARRHEVLPGITGWAQVNGRNAVPWRDRLEMDVWYVDNRSLLLDMRILFMTVEQVLTRRGITAEDHATVPEFTGCDERFDETGEARETD